MTSTGSGNLPSTSTNLDLIGDAHEFAAGRGDDLFPGQGAAAALDEVQISGGLVGAVHVDRDFVHGVQIQDRNPVLLQALRGGDGAGDGAFDLMLDFRQGIDEEIGGGTGADPDDGTRLDVFQGGLGNGLSSWSSCDIVILRVVVACEKSYPP